MSYYYMFIKNKYFLDEDYKQENNLFRMFF